MEIQKKNPGLEPRPHSSGADQASGNGSLLVCMVFSRDRKKAGPRFLSLVGLQAAEFDLASPEGASKVNLSREKAK